MRSVSAVAKIGLWTRIFDAITAPCTLLANEAALSGAWSTLRLLALVICCIQNIAFPLRVTDSTWFNEPTIRSFSSLISLSILPPDWSINISQMSYSYVALSVVTSMIIVWVVVAIRVHLNAPLGNTWLTAFRIATFLLFSIGFTPFLGALLGPLNCKTGFQWADSPWACGERNHAIFAICLAIIAAIYTFLCLCYQLTTVDRRFPQMSRPSSAASLASSTAAAANNNGGVGDIGVAAFTSRRP